MRTQWTLERVVAELQQLNAGGEPVTYSALRANGHGALVSAAEHHAGTFGRALKLAGITYVPPIRRWTARSVLDEIRRLHREGIALSSQQLCASGHAGVVGAARKIYGAWPTAVERAGLPRFKRGAWTSWYAIRRRLRELHHAGVTMTIASLEARGLADLASAARADAGGWNLALVKAGVRVVQHHRSWSSAEVLDELRRLHGEGVSPSYGKMKQAGHAKLVKAAAHYFGTWRAACAAAIPTYVPQLERWSVSRVLARIRARHQAGQSVRSTIVQREEATLTTAARRLGLAWREACRRARVPASAIVPLKPTTRVRWTEATILAQLRRAAADGTPLLVKAFAPGFVGAALRRFRSWPEAMRRARLTRQYERDRTAAAANRLSGQHAPRGTSC